MRSLLGTADLKAINETKLQEFKDSLVQNVQESIGDIDVATSSLEEEQLHNLESAVLRLRMVFPQMGMMNQSKLVCGKPFWRLRIAGNLGTGRKSRYVYL
jgi:hypothetical protein